VNWGTAKDTPTQKMKAIAGNIDVSYIVRQGMRSRKQDSTEQLKICHWRSLLATEAIYLNL
jgi:hypothetical protein